jgi:O-antigen/teichoic acid export membrane protein
LGVIQKGSSLSTAYLIVGILLGFITSGLVLPNYFTEEQNGVITVLSSYYLIYSQIFLLGLHTTVIRFYPHFKNDENRHNGFLSAMSLVVFCSLLIFTVLFFASLYLAPSFFEHSPLFKKHYWLVFPLTIFTVYFYLFDAYYSARLKGSRGFFLKDVVQRVLILLVIFAFIWWQFEFSHFTLLYCVAVCIPTIILAVSLLFQKQFSKKIQYSQLYSDNWRYMAKVSGYSLLLGISWVGVNNIDAIMIEKMIGLKEAGIYGRNMFFGILVSIPYRAIHKIASGVISNSFKENDLENIKSVYYKSSLTQLIIGTFLFLGIWINIDNVYHIIPKTYEAGKYVIFFIGLGNLFSMIGGVNTAVISYSPYYRWNTIFVGVLLILVVVTNLIFIPLWKITGAAIATALSVFLYNLLMYIFLLYKYKFQPLNLKYLWVVLVGLISYFISYQIPILTNFYFDIAVRSGCFTLLFGSATVLFKLSPDINGMIKKLLSTKLKKLK